VQRALARPLAHIVSRVRALLEETPPELAADVGHAGLTLVGGGALLRGLDRLLEHETGLPVSVDAEPLTTVARGAGQALEELERLGRQAKRARR
jgi:rod shape-determining protein MreB